MQPTRVTHIHKVIYRRPYLVFFIWIKWVYLLCGFRLLLGTHLSFVLPFMVFLHQKIRPSYPKKNRSYPVVVYKREFYVYLLAIDTDEFDVILSMNWLSTFYTIIQCRNRRLVFKALNHPKFKFIKGSKLIE